MKLNVHSLNNQNGQTIVEVLIATAVVVMVLTTIVSAMVLSLKNTSQAKYKTLATKLAQEGMESFRRQRDNLGWESFSQTLLTQGSQNYCLNVLPVTSAEFASLTPGVCADQLAYVGIGFMRQATYVVNNADQVTVTMTVTWDDGTMQRKSEMVQQFRNWR